MSTRIAVTGGAGFIGSNFIRFLLRARPDWSVTNFDLLTYSGNLENLTDVEADPRYRFVRGDVCDAKAVGELAASHDVIVHIAAETHVDRSIMDAGPFMRTNAIGMQVVLDAVRRETAKGRRFRLLNVGTDEVYGSLPLDRPEMRFTEDSPLAPNSPYAASKAAGDVLVRAYHHTYGLDVVTTRCSNNFGPFQFPEKVIPLFVTNLLEDQVLPLYGDGLHVRDWLHVEDHCEAILAVLEGGRPGEIYNVGGNNERANIELTRSILSLVGKGEEMIRHVPDRPGHDRRYAIDSSKITRELGWTPTRSEWPAALASTIKWYMDNRAWWERVRSGVYREYYQRQYGQRT